MCWERALEQFNDIVMITEADVLEEPGPRILFRQSGV
jgi:hypothetical protein